MPVGKRLDETILEILNNVEIILNNAITIGGDLEGVKQVFIGDRIRKKPDPPMIWVMCDPASPAHTHRALAETWELPITAVCFVKSLDPEQGYKDANQLAALTRSVLLVDRSLGNIDCVQDVQSGPFMLAQTDPENEAIFGAATTLNIIFTILE